MLHHLCSLWTMVLLRAFNVSGGSLSQPAEPPSNDPKKLHRPVGNAAYNPQGSCEPVAHCRPVAHSFVITLRKILSWSADRCQHACLYSRMHGGKFSLSTFRICIGTEHICGCLQSFLKRRTVDKVIRQLNLQLRDPDLTSVGAM